MSQLEAHVRLRQRYSLCPGVKGSLEDALSAVGGVLDPVCACLLRAGCEGEGKGDEADGEESLGDHFGEDEGCCL